MPATAHVGVVNTQVPYAVAGKSYELVLAVPHGCAYTKADGSAAEADTYKVEIAIPVGFTGARPIVDGVFGKATKSAVWNYQRDHGLATSGLVGKDTVGALFPGGAPAPTARSNWC